VLGVTNFRHFGCNARVRMRETLRTRGAVRRLSSERRHELAYDKKNGQMKEVNEKALAPVENVIAVHDIFLYVFFGVSLVSCYALQRPSRGYVCYCKSDKLLLVILKHDDRKDDNRGENGVARLDEDVGHLSYYLGAFLFSRPRVPLCIQCSGVLCHVWILVQKIA